MSKSNKSESKLYEMCVRGHKYRENYDFEMMGEDITASLGPAKDEQFLPIAAFLKDHLDMDEEDAVDAVEEAKEEAGEDESIDISKMDTEFVGAMQQAAIVGLKGSYSESGELIEHTEEEAEEMVNMMVGGYSVEIGGKVLELSGNVRDVEKFPGSRGGQ